MRLWLHVCSTHLSYSLEFRVAGRGCRPYVGLIWLKTGHANHPSAPNRRLTLNPAIGPRANCRSPFLLSLVAASLLAGCSHSGNPAAAHKVLVLGIDGLDPQLLHKYIEDGRMPNFQRLEREGSYHMLGTSIPPQSPVAWSSVITGMNPGGTGIFDFIHRDPKTMQPVFSMARVEAPKHVLNLGGWSIPFSSGKAELLRHGKAFWQFLDDQGIPATVVRMPVNFPPVATRGRSLA